MGLRTRDKGLYGVVRMDLIDITDKFKGKKIIVIGDIMLDKYIWGDVSRISPEAPVQVVKVEKESFSPGGAANVANNVASLQGISYMVGIVGNDLAKEDLIIELKKRNIMTEGIIADNNKPTIQKIRVVGRGQQLLRFDYEKAGYLDEDHEKELLKFIVTKIKGSDAIILSDYAKGVITKSLSRNIIDLANKFNKPIIIDPKPNHKNFYNNATLITPNNKEACEMASKEVTNNHEIMNIGKNFVTELNSNVIITRGEKGMTVFEKSGEVTDMPTKAKEVFDIVGAGDTVVATLALALATGASLKQAAVLANYAAGITVGKVGTSTVTVEEIKEAIKKDNE